MALVLWLMHAMSHVAAADDSSHLLPRLQDTFDNVMNEVEEEANNLQQELFIWVASVGILAADQTELYEQWFTEKVMKTSRACHIESGVQLLDAIKRLLYIDAVQGDSLRRLAKKVGERPSSQGTE